MPSDKWFINSIEQTLTATGYIIVITTDIASHLWMRWTVIPPQEHLIQRTKRGLAFLADKYYCFDVYEDNDQEEAGDTLIHTFIKEPWAHCETRYFYFHGEIAGVPSKSTTAIFSKHRVQPPITTIFYPDPHPEVTSFDGYAGHNENLLWPALRTAAGNVKDDSGITIIIGFQSGGAPNIFNVMRRAIILFDTSVIPPGSIIISATLGLWGVAKWDTFPIAPGLVVVSSNPLSNIAIAFADYLNLGDIALSNVIGYAAFILGAENTFTLNPAGLALITPAGITKLGIREGEYERPNTEPTWSAGKFALFQFNASEKGGDFRPKLTVTYTPP